MLTGRTWAVAQIATLLAAGLLAAALAQLRPGEAEARARLDQADSQVKVGIPGPVRARAAYNLVLSGVAAARATAYLFVDYAGCARSLTAERRRTGGQSDSFGVKGHFAEVTGWRSSSAGLDHACAYLVAHDGRLLASAQRSYRVG